MHLVFLAARVGLLFFCMLSWCIWLNRKFELKMAQTPLVMICSGGMALYFAALWNMLEPVQLLLLILGPVLALWTLAKEGKKALRPVFTLPMGLYAAVSLWLLNLERGRLIDGHDVLAHWGIMAKSLINDGRLPNTVNLAVEYVDYPPATALWIKLVCNVIGVSDGSMVFAQGILFLAAVLALAPLCEKKASAGLAVFAYGAYLAAASRGWRELKVEGLLTALCVGAAALIVVNRNEPKKAFWTSLPVLGFLAITKNSGLFYVVLAALFFLALPSVPKLRHRLLMAGAAIGLPAFSWWLWGCHVRMVYPDGMSSKHAVSAEAYEMRLEGKTDGEIAYFNSEFTKRWFHFSSAQIRLFWLCTAIFLLACLLLWRMKAVSGKRAALYAGGGLAMTAAWVAALWCTYVFSMPNDEMLVLASFERYSRSFFDCLLGFALLLMLWHAPGHGKKVWLQVAAVAFAGLMLLGIQQENAWVSFYQSARVTAPQARQNQWLELKRQYNLPDRQRYLIYTNGSPMDGWSDRFVGRFALNTDVLDFWQYKEKAPNLNCLGPQYDYILFMGPDDLSRASLERWGLDPNTVVLDKQTLWDRQDALAQAGERYPDPEPVEAIMMEWPD